MTPALRSERLRVGVPAVLALGSNLGDRAVTIRGALEALAADPAIRLDAVSPLYETPALKLSGVSEEAPAYLNAVARIHTVLDPLALLAAANRLEDAAGRVRTERWGDRTLDIDIVDYDGRSSDDPRVTLPHPRAHERGFVLVPWLAVEPGAVLVGWGRVAELVGGVGDVVVWWGDVGVGDAGAGAVATGEFAIGDSSAVESAMVEAATVESVTGDSTTEIPARDPSAASDAANADLTRGVDADADVAGSGSGSITTPADDSTPTPADDSTPTPADDSTPTPAHDSATVTPARDPATPTTPTPTPTPTPPRPEEPGP